MGDEGTGAGADLADSGTAIASGGSKHPDGGADVVPTAPEAALTIFGDRVDVAGQYAALLASAGVERGLLGPREVPRLWDRHLLKCAAIAELIPHGAQVLDVGSGAGLPGIALALARPDLAITLLEPIARRAAFLVEVVQELDLMGVAVIRGRAEELPRSEQPQPRSGSGSGSGDARASIVIARAVAPLERLVTMCLPLVGTGGRLLAIKGNSAQAEVDRGRDAVRRAGGAPARIRLCGVGSVDPPTTVVEIVRGSARSTRRSTR